MKPKVRLEFYASLAGVKGLRSWSIVTGRADSPPCITAAERKRGSAQPQKRRGGCASQKISRSVRRSRSRGGFPIEDEAENHPGCVSFGGFATFIDDAATPPCGDARRGMSRAKLTANVQTPGREAPDEGRYDESVRIPALTRRFAPPSPGGRGTHHKQVSIFAGSWKPRQAWFPGDQHS